MVVIALCLGAFVFLRKNNNVDVNIKVIAKSKVGNVTNKDVESYLSNLEKTFGQKINFDSLKPEEKKLIIDEIVNNKVILSKARKSPIKNSVAYKEKIKELEDGLLREMFLQDVINKNISENDIKKRYDDINKILEGKMEYKVRHILVKTKPEILKVVKELKTKTFEEVAEKYSIDSSKSNGGDLGYIIDGQTVKEFNDVLKAQPKNKLSEPFETQFGWHVLIKEDERKATISSYENSKNTVRDALVRDFLRDYSLENIKDVNIIILDK